MKVLKYSIIGKVIIKKDKRDVEIIFLMIKNIKKMRRRYFLKAHSHLLKFLKK